jgi:REP element-mobilizing transposase RayT
MIQSVGFRLHDSLPKQVLEKWERELKLTELRSRRIDEKLKAGRPSVGDRQEPKRREIELRKRIAHYEDEGHGACWLRRRDIGQLIEDALLCFDSRRYRMLAWCVMPNHVHVLFECLEGWPLAELVHSWKSFTANKANKMLQRRGEFWQRDYLDRYIRNAEHYNQAISYIESNPVKASLVVKACDWPWSSAKFRLGAPTSLPTNH